MNEVYGLLLSLLFCVTVCGQDAFDEHFVMRVLPVLESKCFPCHGETSENFKGGLDATSLQGLLKGGESGIASIVIDSPDKSLPGRSDQMGRAGDAAQSK